MKRLFFPIYAIATLGLAIPVAGCHSKAKVQIEAQSPPPPPPPAPPPPPPPEEPKPAPIVDNKIVLPGELEFDTNKASIKETEQSMTILNELAKVMKDNPKITKLRIEGHTDNTGTRRRNTKLSQQRAEAVAKWLSDHEIDKTRLTAVGYADTRPVTDNDSAEHRALNRRTEFHLQEVDGKPVSDENAATGK